MKPLTREDARDLAAQAGIIAGGLAIYIVVTETPVPSDVRVGLGILALVALVLRGWAELVEVTP